MRCLKVSSQRIWRSIRIIHGSEITRNQWNRFKELLTKEYVLVRKLDKETVVVYPIHNYWAIAAGQHTFCHNENEKHDYGTPNKTPKPINQTLSRQMCNLNGLSKP
ncbi:MAG: hypothetical protein FJY07_03530 [Bacteroidetes bacterium]|nr:hypothetical protein [Bacteroidota bacterium]